MLRRIKAISICKKLLIEKVVQEEVEFFWTLLRILDNVVKLQNVRQKKHKEQNNGSIPCLDIRVMRIDSNIEINWYRKLMESSRILSFHS